MNFLAHPPGHYTRSLRVLVCAGAMAWSTAVLHLAFSPSGAHAARMLLHVFTLASPANLRVVIAAEPLQGVSAIAGQVRFDGHAVAQEILPWVAEKNHPRLSLRVPVRPVGTVEVRLAALDQKGCLRASGVAYYQASGEENIELPIQLVPVQMRPCATEVPRHLDPRIHDD